MVCRTASNQPLVDMSHAIGTPMRCHSRRGDCIKGLERQLDNDHVMGALGAAIGYCQGLFHRQKSPEEHTQYVLDSLSSMGAPWARSHELLWDYKGSEQVGEYLTRAMAPLRVQGRVPVVITNLDPASDYGEIAQIFNAQALGFAGETILVRMALNNDDSILPAVRLMRETFKQAEKSKNMPAFWPLWQAEYSAAQWRAIKQQAGTLWQYANVALTPFVTAQALEEIGDQATVAQFLLGKADDMHADGTVLVPRLGCAGSMTPDEYNMFDYAHKVQPYGPTAIICGPTMQDWTAEENMCRVHKYLDVFRQVTPLLWKHVDVQIREQILKLSG